MFSLLETTVKPLLLNTKVLEAVSKLYLEAPQSDYPEIDLKELSNQTGASLLGCRTAIVGTRQVGRFPKCSLRS
jgi:hypothetical protein